MAAVVRGGCLFGIEGLEVRVEAALVRRLPRVIVVGLPASAVRESVERVRSAILASGFEFPKRCITVNLAPSGVRKEGTGLDLAIAVGILVAAGEVEQHQVADILMVGELGLQGDLKRVPGTLALALLASRNEIPRLLVPEGSGGQAAHVSGLNVFEASTLREAVEVLRNQKTRAPCVASRQADGPRQEQLEEVVGQPLATRAVELAAAGGHSLLLSGPPGVGKTMLAKRLVALLPPLTLSESLEVTTIHARTGAEAAAGELVTRPPFRAPHHSISRAGLLGSARLLPGEVSLAHRGVLLLDEVPEFSRQVLEMLRGPLEEHKVCISRAEGSVVFPAFCIVVATANPCPCGYWGHPVRACSCTDGQLQRYRQRISGPLLDRIDLRVEMEPLPLSAPEGASARVPLREFRHRVRAARRVQAERNATSVGWTNAESSCTSLLRSGLYQPNTMRRLDQACDAFSLSARARSRLIRVARTVADLEESAEVGVEHLNEALLFRETSWGAA